MNALCNTRYIHTDTFSRLVVLKRQTFAQIYNKLIPENHIVSIWFVTISVCVRDLFLSSPFYTHEDVHSVRR